MLTDTCVVSWGADGVSVELLSMLTDTCVASWGTDGVSVVKTCEACGNQYMILFKL